MSERFFFDANLSYRYANMLRAIKQDVVHIAKTRDFTRDDKDLEWMPKVAAHGWIAVTLDEAIRRRAVEELARARVQLRVVYIAEGFRNHLFMQQAQFLLNAWPDILKATEKSRPGQCFRVTAQKKVTRL